MIAASFAGLSTKVSSMHRFLLSKYTVPGVSPGSLPANDALDGLAEALGIAAKAYRDVKRSRGGRGRPLMLMVVQPGERNAFDQQWMSTRLWEQHGVDTMRRTLVRVSRRALEHPVVGRDVRGCHGEGDTGGGGMRIESVLWRR